MKIDMKLDAVFHFDFPKVDIQINQAGKDYTDMTPEEKSSVIYVLATILDKMADDVKKERKNGEEE